MNSLISLGMIRAATGLARHAVETVGDAAAAAVNPTALKSTSFAEMLGSDSTDTGLSVAEVRGKLTTAIESALRRMNLSADPALAFVAHDDGTVRIEGDHAHAAAIEANLNDDTDVQSFAARLSAISTGGDRRLVLHSIAAG